METFKDYAYYYNAFYKDKDYKKEAKQIDCLLKRFGKNIQYIIDFGCGTGRHDIELAKRGYQCEGIDISPSMIQIAKENIAKEECKVEFSVADIQNFEPKKRYDAVISLFHVMSYQSENSNIIKAFESARKSLNREGIFLFDVCYGSGVLSDKPCVRVKEIEDYDRKLIRIALPVMHEKKNVVQVDYEVYVINKKTSETQVINETHNMRYYFRPELEFMLQESAFELIDNFDCFTLGETDFDSWTSYFVAKAV